MARRTVCGEPEHRIQRTGQRMPRAGKGKTAMEWIMLPGPGIRIQLIPAGMDGAEVHIIRITAVSADGTVRRASPENRGIRPGTADRARHRLRGEPDTTGLRLPRDEEELEDGRF